MFRTFNISNVLYLYRLSSTSFRIWFVTVGSCFFIFKVAMWVESEPLLEVLVVDWLQLARGGIHFLMCGANCDWLI